MPRLFNNICDENFRKFVFGKPTKLNDGRYFIPLAFKENEEMESEPVLIQVNKSHSLGNLIIDDEIVKNFDFSVNEKTKDVLAEFDEQILSITKEKSKDWFPENADAMTDSFFDNAILPSFKSSKKNHKFSARTTSNIRVFNSHHEEQDLNDVVEDMNLNCIVQAYGIWFTKTRFGITWRIHQIKINTPKKPPTECLFKEDEEKTEDLDNIFPDVNQ